MKAANLWHPEEPGGEAVVTSTGEALQHAIKERRADSDRLYAIVDAARNLALKNMAQDRFGAELRWLFDPTTPAHMADVAPYVVPIESPSDETNQEFLGSWESALGSSCGILLLSDAAMDDLHEHLVSVFHMTDEAGKNYFFRFYDPRVLASVLHTFTSSEVKELFGPIRFIVTESDQAGMLRFYSPGSTGLRVEEVPLEQTL